MYCPKCGTKNPDPGRFCRKCGIGLPKAFGEEGHSEYEEAANEMTAPHSSGSGGKPKREKESITSWEGATVFIASGLGFLVLAIVLAFQPMGSGWWFWLLIPGFGGLGTGLGQVIALRKMERKEPRTSGGLSGKQITGSEREALPPERTVFADDEVRIPEKPGELAPPSVTESTTRHLELDNEGETARLKDEQ